MNFRDEYKSVDDVRSKNPFLYYGILSSIPVVKGVGNRWTWTGITSCEIPFVHPPEGRSADDWRQPILHRIRLSRKTGKSEVREAEGFVVERADGRGRGARYVSLDRDDQSFWEALAPGRILVDVGQVRDCLAVYHLLGRPARLSCRMVESLGDDDLSKTEVRPDLAGIARLEGILGAAGVASDATRDDQARLRKACAELSRLPVKTDATGVHTAWFLRKEVGALRAVRAEVKADGTIRTWDEAKLADLFSSQGLSLPDEAPWVGKRHRAGDLSQSERRRFRDSELQAAVRDHPTWVPDGATKDPETVRTEAERTFARRMSTSDWETIWPSDDRAARSEAIAFAKEVDARCPDVCLDLKEPAGAAGDAEDRPGSMATARFKIRRWLLGFWPGYGAAGDANDQPGNMASARFKIRRWRLGFWPGYAVYEIAELHGNTPKETQFVWFRGQDESVVAAELDLLPLDGGSYTIRKVNQALMAAGKPFAGDDALDYLRFFGGVVQGEAGIFAIIERDEDLRKRGSWRTDDDAGRLIHPLRLWAGSGAAEGRAENDPVVVGATVAYARILFQASFELGEDRVPQMTHDQQLLTQLAVRPGLWTSHTHFLVGKPAPKSGAGA